MSAARSVRPALMMLAVYFLSTWAGVAAVQAQTGPVPDVSLSCDQPQPIDVYPGATRSTIINCRVENPTVHQEKVRITIQAGVLAVSGPASLTVGSGSEVSFQVSVRAELRAPEGQHQVSISAEVTMANGIPVTSDPTSYNIMAIIRQFSRLRVASEVAFLQLRPKVDYMLVFDVYNDGNAMDRFNIEIQNYDDLNDEGFQLSIPLVSVEIESMAPAEKIRVQMRTPKNQGWTDKYFSLQFKATSEYSVRTEGIPNYQVQTMTIYIRGVYLPGFELIGTAMMTALAAAAFAGRTSRYSEDEDSELVELDSRIF
ncbi:MAG: choice-of-anchor T family protein [Candidatus Thalassarchaeaceae archaeon]|nr:choice-of-anchor T family protein [Candidatus Thalassarchaeaceae archaeon]|tara:strand:+ start:91 stop:1029 length:939 start_codon:yes stop_codon:yes gene_type:complete